MSRSGFALGVQSRGSPGLSRPAPTRKEEHDVGQPRGGERLLLIEAPFTGLAYVVARIFRHRRGRYHATPD